MKRVMRVTVGLGVVGALVLVSPALGGPSLRSLVEQEVAKQLGSEGATAAKKGKGKRGPRGARGPAGPAGAAGPTGPAGPQGAAGSSRAYAAVVSDAVGDCEPDGCDFDLAKNITAVTHPATGIYCVDVTGFDVDTTDVPAVVTVDGLTSGDVATASAAVNSGGCGAPDTGSYQVVTSRLDLTGPTAALADDVGFIFVLP